MTGALRWGLPADHPGSQTPWLPTLIAGLADVVNYLDDRFLSRDLEDAPKPAPFETFEAALERDKEPADPWLAGFLRIDEFMRDLVCWEGDPFPEEAYPVSARGSPSPTATGPSTKPSPGISATN